MYGFWGISFFSCRNRRRQRMTQKAGVRRLVSGIISQVPLTQTSDDQHHPTLLLQCFYSGWLTSQSLISCSQISAPLKRDLTFLHQVPADQWSKFLLVLVTFSCFGFHHPRCACANWTQQLEEDTAPSPTHQGCVCLSGPFGPKGNKNWEGSRLTVSLDLVDLSSSSSLLSHNLPCWGSWLWTQNDLLSKI